MLLDATPPTNNPAANDAAIGIQFEGANFENHVSSPSSENQLMDLKKVVGGLKNEVLRKMESLTLTLGKLSEDEAFSFRDSIQRTASSAVGTKWTTSNKRTIGI